MRDQPFLHFVAVVLMAAWLFVSCTPLSTPTEDVTTPGRCGDGVCDQAEKEDPDLCPQDCPSALPATSSPMPDNPPLQDTPSSPGEKCGDGVCDEMEQKDPALCPQDCPTETKPAAGTTPGAGTGMPDYEPPINVFVVLHIDPLGDLGLETFQPDPGMYLRTYEEIDWLMDEAIRHDLKFSALYNGWYTKWALEHEDLDQFSALLAAGHEIGSHAHQITYDQASNAWIAHIEELSIFGRPNYDPDLARQAWNDASRYVDEVLQSVGAANQNRIMCATALSLSDERELMAEFGFALASGNRLEAGVNYLGHMPWNPWRAANSDEPGYEIAEDLTAPYPSINHGAQIGEAMSHSVGVTVPQLQRQFLQLYTEWLYRERTGADDRVWSFGFVYHPNQGDKYNADLVEFLDWLDTYFIHQQSLYGNTIAQYASISEITAEFYSWEESHPGVSSFHYVKGDPYPYTYASLAEKLKDASYEAHVDLGEGVSCFRFTKDGQSIYLVWSDHGGKRIDFSSQLSGEVRITDTLGNTSVQIASDLDITEEPLLVEP